MLKDKTLWAGLLGLLGLFLVSSSAFLGLIDEMYLHAFFGLTTARKYSVRPEWLTDEIIAKLPDKYLKKQQKIKKLDD